MFVSVQITKSSRIEKQSYQIDSQNALKMFLTIFGSIDNKTRHNNDKMRLKWYCCRNCIIANGIHKAADMWSLCQGPISWPFNQFVITAGFHDGTHQNQTSKSYLMCRREHFDFRCSSGKKTLHEIWPRASRMNAMARHITTECNANGSHQYSNSTK